MIRTAILAPAAMLVAACGASVTSDDGPAAVCMGMLGGDPEIEQNLAQHSTDVSTYCGCFADHLDSQGETNKVTILKVSQILADLRDERRINVDDAADLLMDDTAGATHGVTEAEFEVTERYVERMRRELFDEDGLCHAMIAE